MVEATAEAGEVTTALAQDMLALRPSTEDLERTADLLIDHLGVAAAGTSRPWVAALSEWAARRGASGPCVVLGSARHAAADAAAFVNAVAGHSYELDDTHDASMSHPGAVIFPVALALGAELPCRGSEMLGAAAAGYETMARLGRAAQAAEVIAVGFHPTSLFGVFGAAATAARLMGLSASQLSCAWGHALSLAGGSMQFSQEAHGGDVKRMHAGYAARAGILAAEMAAGGLSAPAASLEGRYGLFSLFGAGAVDLPALRGRTALAVHEVSLKSYACNRLLHAMIDGLRATTGFGIPRDRVTRLTVRGPRKLREQHMVRRPSSVMAAQYSLPFTVGAAMVFGEGAIDAYEPGELGNPEILAWADLVEVVADPDLQRLYPERFPAEVELELASGEVRRSRVLDSRGTPAQPMDRTEIFAKAVALAGRRLPAGAWDRIARAAAETPRAANLSELLDALDWKQGGDRWTCS